MKKAERKNKKIPRAPTERLVRLWVRYALAYMLVMAIPFTVFSILISRSVNESAEKEIRSEMALTLDKWREAFEQKAEQMNAISLQLSQLPVFQHPALKEYSYTSRMEIRRMLAVFCHTGLGYQDIAYYSRKLPDVVFTSSGTYQTSDYRRLLKEGKPCCLKDLSDEDLTRTWFAANESTPGATQKGKNLIRCLPLGDIPGGFLLFEISEADFSSMMPPVQKDSQLAVRDGEKELYPFIPADTNAPECTNLSATDPLSGLVYTYSCQIEKPGVRARNTLLVYSAVISVIGILCLAAVAVIARHHARPIEELIRMTDDYVPDEVTGVARLENAMNQLDTYSKKAVALQNEVMRRKVLTGLIRGRYETEEKATQKLAELDMNFRYSWHTIVLLKQEQPMEEEEPACVFGPLSVGFDVYGFSYALRSMYVLLIGMPDEDRTPLLSELEKISNVEEVAEAGSRFAVSCPFTGLTGAGEAYMEALGALHTVTESRVCACEHKDGENRFDPEEELEALNAALTQRDRSRIGFLYDVLMNMALKNRQDWLYTVTLLSRMIHLYASARICPETEEPKIRVNDPEDMMEYLRTLHDGLMRDLKAREDSGAWNGIQAVAGYISSCTELDTLTVSSVAEKFGMSPSSLSHRFKAQMNCNISDYIFTCKMNHACALLRATDMTVAEIAGKVGYSQYTSFVRQFKRECEMTPTAYRDMWRKSQGIHSEQEDHDET